jgi:MscS family membrane protein
MTLAFRIDGLWTFELLHNPVWRWAALLGVLLTTFVAAKIVAFLLERQSRRFEASPRLKVLEILLKSTVGPAQLLVFAGGLHFAQAVLGLVLDVDSAQKPLPTGPIRVFWVAATKALAAMAVAWFIFRLVDVLEHMLRKWTAGTQTALDDQLVPLVRKTLRVFIVIVAGIFIAQNVFDMNVGALLAGLGIGGLAIALAAQDSIANFFGSVIICTDRPFALSEQVKIGVHEGIVEEVGFRSTRLRTPEGYLVTIPNSMVAREAVRNMSRRPSISRVLNVTVPYDTPPGKLERAMAILREMLDARKDLLGGDSPPRVYFNDFNPDSMNIVVQYWFSPPDWWEYVRLNHDFNMELLKRFNEEGIKFASSTRPA